MAPSIDNAFIRKYDALVRHLSQQGDLRIRPHVMEVASNAAQYSWDRLAATAAVEKTARRLDTVYVDDVWTRRVAVPRTFTHTMTIEHEDKVQMIANPNSEYAHNQAMAMKRQWDDLCIEAATGDSLDGDGVAVTFPAGQKVSDGSVPISFDLITEVQELFLTNEITMDVPKVMIVGPTQIRKLLQLTEQTSADFVQREALQKLSQYGIVPGWMGFTWIMSNRLLAPAGGEISCLAFTKRALGLAVNQNTFTRIGEDPSKSYMMQVFSQFTGGATRVEDEHIVHLHLLDSL